MIRRHHCGVKAYLQHQFRHLGCLVSQVVSLPCTGVHDIHHLIRFSAHIHRNLRAGVTTQVTCKTLRMYIIVMCAQDRKYASPRTLSCGISRTCLTNVIEPSLQIQWCCTDLEITGSACKQSSLVHAAHMLQKVGGHFEALRTSGCGECIELAASVNKDKTSSRTVLA